MVSLAFRTTASLVVVAVIVGLLFSTAVLSVGAGRSAELASERLGADMVVLPPILDRVQSYGYATTTLNSASVSTSYFASSTVNEISNLSAIARVSPQLYVGTMNSSVPGHPAIELVAFDQMTDFAVLPWLGGQSKIHLGDRDALAGAGTGLDKGDQLTWEGLSLNIVGVLDKSDTRLDGAVFFPLPTAYAVANSSGTGVPYGPGQVSVLLVRLHSGYIPDIVGRQISGRLVFSKVVVARDIERGVGAQISGIMTFQLLQEGVVGAGFLMLVGFLFSMSANENRRQLGLLRSLGATRRFLAKMMLFEACLTAALGTVLGIGIGSALAYVGANPLVHAFRLPALQPSLADVLPLVGGFAILGVGLGAAAALYPALVTSRAEPYEAIRRGD